MIMATVECYGVVMDRGWYMVAKRLFVGQASDWQVGKNGRWYLNKTRIASGCADLKVSKSFGFGFQFFLHWEVRW